MAGHNIFSGGYTDDVLEKALANQPDVTPDSRNHSWLSQAVSNFLWGDGTTTFRERANGAGTAPTSASASAWDTSAPTSTTLVGGRPADKIITEDDDDKTVAAKEVDEAYKRLADRSYEDDDEAAPLTATESINQAFNEAVSDGQIDYQQAQQAQAAAQAQQAIAPLLGRIANPMNIAQRRLAKGILDSKVAWDQLNKAAAEAMENGDEETAQQLYEQRDKVARDADRFRQAATAAGVNVHDAYGAGSSLDAAQTAYEADTMAGLNQIFGDNKSSDDVYNEAYNEYRRKGYSDRRARNYAAREAGDYRLKRISQIDNAFGAYGLDADGSINDYGMQMLGMMGREDGNQAQALGAGRATRKDVWDAQMRRQFMQDQMAAAMQRDAQKFANQMALKEMSGGGSGGSSGGSGGSSGGDDDTVYLSEAQVKALRGLREQLELAKGAVAEIGRRLRNGEDRELVAEETGDAIEEARKAFKKLRTAGTIPNNGWVDEVNFMFDDIVNDRETAFGYKPKW